MSLDLSCSTDYIPDVTLMKIFHNNPTLLHIDLSSMDTADLSATKTVTDDVIKCIAESCTNLTYIDLSGCTYVSSKGVFCCCW